MRSFMCAHVMLVRDSEFQLDIMCCGYSVLLIHQQLRFKCPEPPIKSNQPIKLPRLWGQIRASVRFYWLSPMSAREFSSM